MRIIVLIAVLSFFTTFISPAHANQANQADQLDNVGITLAKICFELYHPDNLNVPACASYIFDLVENGKTNWSELGFTKADVQKLEKNHWLWLSQKHFDSMLTNTVYAHSYAWAINSIVADKGISWSELGFTKADVEARISFNK